MRIIKKEKPIDKTNVYRIVVEGDENDDDYTHLTTYLTPEEFEEDYPHILEMFEDVSAYREKCEEYYEEHKHEEKWWDSYYNSDWMCNYLPSTVNDGAEIHSASFDSIEYIDENGKIFDVEVIL